MLQDKYFFSFYDFMLWNVLCLNFSKLYDLEQNGK